MDPQKWWCHCRVKVYVTAHIGIGCVGVAALVSILLTGGMGYAQVIPRLPIPPPRPTLPNTPQSTPPVLPAKQAERSTTPATLDRVFGHACHTYGDEETPARAKEIARKKAQEQAVESHHVMVHASKTVENYQLKQDLVQTASAGLLKHVTIEKEEKKPDQTICVTISAQLSPLTFEETVRQQVTAKQVNGEVAATNVLAPATRGGIRLSTNKADGRFVEDDRLILTILSETDGYLKLDYYQADNTVVHLVPNLLNQEVRVKAGEPFVFGGSATPPHVVIQGPYGHETIKAMVSEQPFPLEMNSTKPVDDSRAYLNSQRSASRGGRLVLGFEQSIPIVTVSKALNEYRDVRR